MHPARPSAPPAGGLSVGPGASPWLTVLLPFAAGYYVSHLFRTVNAVIGPALALELGAGPADLGLLSSTYFLAFAVAQLPVGVALDRWGPRRIVSGFMALAAVGAAVFATGHTLAQLAAGRALIGFGVSACLMGGLNALAVAFPPERQASVTGFIMAAGAGGALSASLPLERLLPVVGWRWALAGVAGLSAAAAVLIAVVSPRVAAPAAAGTDAPAGRTFNLRGDLEVLGLIARAEPFWRYAPQAAFFTGGFMALQGLWAGPFLTAVEGRTATGAAYGLLCLNLGMLAGQLTIAFGAPGLARAGLSRRALMSLSLGLALVVEAVVIVRPAGGALANLPWFGFGFFSAASAQVYGVTAAAFAPELGARVSTAINQFAFVGAFALQWGMGGAVELLGRQRPPALALRIGFAALWGMQVLALAWSVRPRRGARPGG